MTTYVLVLASNRKPLMPCHPARARELLKKGKAAVFRTFPFTIVLKERDNGVTQPITLGIDPGSKTTGLALTVEGAKATRCVLGINLHHRGKVISQSLTDRRNYRRSRRQRKTRYRQPRFLNRTKPKGWLAPSVLHRVLTTETWVKRLIRWAPVTLHAIEYVSFDTQKLDNPDIAGKEYQQGTLFGYEVKEYLLYRYKHTCQYCSGISKDTVLQIEHIVPRSLGGSNRVSNLTIACRVCNYSKGGRTPQGWLSTLLSSNRPLDIARVKHIPRVLKGVKPSLRDAAAMNSIRNALIWRLAQTKIPYIKVPSFETKYHRRMANLRKDHWIDAAVLIKPVILPKGLWCYNAKATVKTSRRMIRPNRYGFPSTTKPKGPSSVFGFKSGDMVRAYGHIGKLVVRFSTNFDISLDGKRISVNHRNCKLIQRKDGYVYSFGTEIKLLLRSDVGKDYIKTKRI